ncbi:MAG: N-6 DNA methylase [Myxococcales bacterium]|jgi:hypothetical protein|nr:N-6 DNA methylase [Myxococcales bacterium]
MAGRRKSTKRDSLSAQLAFEALLIEGGMLSPDWLARAAQLSAGQQTEADYRIPKGLNLRDEIGRYWRIAQAYFADYQRGQKSGADPLLLSQRFVQGLLRESFGFSSLESIEPITIADRIYPIGQGALSGRVPVVIAPAGSGLDTLAPAFGDGSRRRSAFGLTQEFLNAADDALWGLCSDGNTLRIARDNASLTRPAWIEADLLRIFTEERYADFAALWLLCHETRFGRPKTENQPVTDCALEAWRTAGREQGTRAREHLRIGVEEALLALGQGFLTHPDNHSLRTALHQGTLTTSAYFQQLLRLVYRLIFLITAEERELLHPERAEPSAMSLYQSSYSMRRLRDRSTRRSAHDRFFDLWESVKIVFRGLADGESRLALPALAGLFASAQCHVLTDSRLENRALLLAVFRLTWLRESTGLSRVNWRDMGPEELGSVYESLLELTPQITQDGRQFAFASGGETKGNARKTTGSYYTPDSLVQVLLDSALDPVIADTIAKHPDQPVAALLGLSIVDPACGSGHFLLAAARRLAGQVARLQAGGTPSAAEYRHALRQVVGHCIYGVDLNAMAVELCKVSLWMEALEPGLPLTFLDSHVQHGNALLGATPSLLEKGIPDAAWDAIEGDDKKTASALKKRNKAASGGQRELDSLWSQPSDGEAATVVRAAQDLESASDADLGLLHQKESRWQSILESAAFRRQRLVADMFCAAFVWPKQPGPLAEAAPVSGLWLQLRDHKGVVPALTVETTCALATQYHFLHWHLGFPHIFAKGGFDVVLGNPPWERVKLQEQEFFASRSAEIATASNASVRKKLIATLPDTDPNLWKEWCAASREAEGQSHLIRQSGRYPLCGKGDINTYALFAEHNRTILDPKGRAGFIVPTGIATDEGTSGFLRAVVTDRALQEIISYENEGTTFGGVNNRQSFCLLVLSRVPIDKTRLTFFVNQPLPANAGPLDFQLAPADFALFNPNTGNCPTFRARRDAQINLTMYRQAGVLWRDDDPNGNPWRIRFMTMLHMASDSGLFRFKGQLESEGYVLRGNRFLGSGGEYVPLLEAKMLFAFDHRYGTYEGATEAHYNKGFLPHFDDNDHAEPNRLSLPDAWVRRSEVDKILSGRWARDWLLGWRDICRRTDVRTVIATLIPRLAIGHTSPLLFSEASPILVAALYANLCSFPLDYAARQKIGGTHLTYGYLKQFPVLPPTTYEAATPWSASTLLKDWILSRVLELTYTAWDLESFARDVGYEGPPFRWDADRRFLLRAELDAAFFHLYGISRDDTDYVMDTFPIVKRNDEKAHGEYRTKRAILEMYDAMSDAVRTGKAYQTRLDPPPADPRVAHSVESRRV